MIVRAARIVVAIAIAAIAGYVGYKLIESPQNQFFGPTIVRGATTSREVALTFDDGPNPPYTERILGVLAAEHVPATFFVVGRAVAHDPQALRLMVTDGDAIGNHTWDHSHLLVHSSAYEARELARTDEAVFRAAGVHTKLMRPPFGARDFATIAEARKEGYSVVMWSVPLAKDWEQPGSSTIARRILRNVRPGSIIVLHDGNRGYVCRPRAALCDRSQDVAATRLIVETLRARGYRFVTVPELLGGLDPVAAGAGHANRRPAKSMNPSG